MGVPITSLSSYDEASRNPFARMLYPLGPVSVTTQGKLYEMERSIILDHAEHESCIIIGRCADYILRNFGNVLNVFIYAPYDTRIRNSVTNLGLEPSVAKKWSMALTGQGHATTRYMAAVIMKAINQSIY